MREKDPTQKGRGRKDAPEEDARAQSIRFLLNVINATIYASGDDYDGALQEFFPQVQALGLLIGARDLDQVSRYLRRRSLWQ